MTFNLQDMTIRSEKVSSRLRAYLYNISRYSNFDDGMKIRVFVASDLDFTAFGLKCHNERNPCLQLPTS